MTIILYKSPGERNLLKRKMTVVKTMSTVELTAPVNVETPDILIDRDDSIIGFDYAKIETFGRYYFLNSLEIVNGNQFLLHLESDPLMSFQSGILSSPCIAKRSSSNVNPELEDSEAAFKTIPTKINRKLSPGFTPTATGGCYILTLGGK